MGAPIGTQGQRDKILAFVEVDPRNTEDVMRTIFDCGVAYIGFPVPSNVTYENPVWDYDPDATMTDDGHAVVLVGYNDEGAVAISWGQRYTLTWAFINKIVDEVYAIADGSWINAGGNTPASMTLEQMEAQMEAIKESSGPE